MMAIAKRAEQAQNQAGKPHRVNAISAGNMDSLVAEAVAKALAGYSGPAPSIAASAPAPGPSQPKGKNKGKDASSVWCFFCLVKGHYASTCVKRNEERSKNIWRPTVRCPQMSRDAYDKLSRDEKNIGHNMVNSSTSVSASAVAASSLTNNGRSYREVSDLGSYQ